MFDVFWYSAGGGNFIVNILFAVSDGQNLMLFAVVLENTAWSMLGGSGCFSKAQTAALTCGLGVGACGWVGEGVGCGGGGATSLLRTNLPPFLQLCAPNVQDGGGVGARQSGGYGSGIHQFGAHQPSLPFLQVRAPNVQE
jgi:hypothetical protein